jgi:hypothetical protein
MKTFLALSLVLFPGLGLLVRGAEAPRPSAPDAWASWEPRALKAPVAIELTHNPLQPLSTAPAPKSFSGGRAELAERLARFLKGRIKGVIRDGDRSSVFIGSRGYTQGQEIGLTPENDRSAHSLKVVLKRIEAERLVFLVTYSASPSVMPADVAVPLDPFCHAR